MYDVLPESSLSGMSAEDFRLILCGCAHIDIDVLRSITIFDDESRKFASQKLIGTIGFLLEISSHNFGETSDGNHVSCIPFHSNRYGGL